MMKVETFNQAIKLKWLMSSTKGRIIGRARARFLAKLYLPQGRTPDYQGPVPLGTGGLTPKKKVETYKDKLCKYMS